MALKVERYEGFNADLFHEYEIYKNITGCPCKGTASSVQFSAHLAMPWSCTITLDQGYATCLRPPSPHVAVVVSQTVSTHRAVCISSVTDTRMYRLPSSLAADGLLLAYALCPSP